MVKKKRQKLTARKTTGGTSICVPLGRSGPPPAASHLPLPEPLPFESPSPLTKLPTSVQLSPKPTTSARVISKRQQNSAGRSVRATLLFSSQRASERLLALTNPCWSLPEGCPWFTEVESKALLPYTPLKVKIWR